MNNTLNQVAGAIGTALLVTIMSTRSETHAAEFTTDAMKNVGGQPTAEMQQQIVTQGMLEGINDAFFVSTFIAGIALVLALFIKRATPANDSFEAKPTAQTNEKKWPSGQLDFNRCCYC